ncbi:unnamed protein product [Sphagnum jensenii]|jgi:hypothetical protein|uniref:Uncharacterized protein n=1 Tax=Sphagnum jensenii TaxID=128206 RepID=A0ABP0W8E1_9BRYO
MVAATVCAVNLFFPVLISSHEYSSAIQYRAKFASTMMKRHNSSSLVLLQWASKERRTRVSEASSLVSSLELAKSRGWMSRIGALEEDDQGAVSTTSSTGTEEEEEEEEEETSSTSAIKPSPPISEKRARAKAAQERGQATAIVTGAVAVLLGVGYLVLVRLLDTRGVTLIPPPPEAFDP